MADGMKLLPSVMRFHGRDIVRVAMPGPPTWPSGPHGPAQTQLPIQPFYRSSGRNSRMPGHWLPFDGIHPQPWFIKDRFCDRKLKGSPLYRYGTEEYRAAGLMLDAMTIEPAAETEDIHAINKWLGLY